MYYGSHLHWPTNLQIWLFHSVFFCTVSFHHCGYIGDDKFLVEIHMFREAQTHWHPDAKKILGCILYSLGFSSCWRGNRDQWAQEDMISSTRSRSNSCMPCILYNLCIKVKDLRALGGIIPCKARLNLSYALASCYLLLKPLVLPFRNSG